MRKIDNKSTAKKSSAGKIVVRIVIAIVAIAILGATGFFGAKELARVSKENKFTRIEQELEYCRELVSVKMRYSDIVSLKRQAGFARSYSIVKYTGVVRAGIADITKASISLGQDRNSAIVVLPRPELLGNDLESWEVFDEQQSMFKSVRISTDEVFSEVDKSRSEEVEKLLAEGLLDEAGEQACKIVKAMLIGAGFTNAEVSIHQPVLLR